MVTAELLAATTSGKLRGVVEGGVHVFKGVVYGSPPVGPQRFVQARPVEPWSGVRDAVEYGPMCPQVGLSGGRRAAASGTLAEVVPTARRVDEGCLTLNLWTPGVADGARRPVLVWIHGGGFHAGTGSAPLYDGAALASRGDVVIVSINHRLGVLGFLHLGPLMGDEYRSSGVVGLLDIVAALRWVRENVESFGGDPGNVTIFGQSGGGQKVGTLMAMASAQGLFHRAAAQSGAALHVGVRVDPAEVATSVLDHLRCDPGDVERLRTVPVDDLLDAAEAAASRFGVMVFEPVVDGSELAAHPVDLLGAGVASQVPLLIGTTTNEFRFLATTAPGAGIGDAELVAQLAGLIGRRDTAAGVHPAIAAYRARRAGANNSELLGEIFTDYAHVLAIRYAEAKTAHSSAPVFMYLFDEPPAYHGSELPYLFRYGVTDEVADQVSDTWIAFARHGAPQHAGLPVWPPYSLGDRSTMVLKRGPGVAMDPLREIRLWWETIPTLM